MQFMSEINQLNDSYCNDIPANTGRQMVISFAIGAVITTILRSDIKAGLVAGALAATAAGIHGFVSPVFQTYAQPRTLLAWHEEMCRTSIALIGTGCIAMAFGNYSVINNLFTTVLIYSFICLQPQRRHVNRAGLFGWIGNN